MVATHAGIMYIPQAEEKQKGQIGNWILYQRGKKICPSALLLLARIVSHGHPYLQGSLGKRVL